MHNGGIVGAVAKTGSYSTVAKRHAELSETVWLDARKLLCRCDLAAKCLVTPCSIDCHGSKNMSEMRLPADTHTTTWATANSLSFTCEIRVAQSNVAFAIVKVILF